MSIQPVNKAVEHLINSTPVLGKEEEKKKAVNACLIKNIKGGGGGERKRERERERERERGGGGGHSHKQSEGLGGVLWVYTTGLK